MVVQILALAALGIVAWRYLDATVRALDVFADYHAYYRAAANLRDGADLYGEGKLLLERNSYDYWTQTDGQYVYPPLLAILLLPLAAILDIGRGGVIWLLALTLALAGFVWATTHVLGRPLRAGLVVPVAGLVLAGLPLLLGLRYGRQPFLFGLTALATLALLTSLGLLRIWARLSHRPRRSRPLLAELQGAVPVLLPVLGGVPLLLGIRYGQVDVILLLLTTLSLLAYLRGRDALAGVALGAAAAVKPTLAFYGLFYLRKGRWTTLGAAALTGLVLGLGPFAILGPDALGDWLAISRYFTGDDYPTYPSNQSVRGFLLRAFAGGPRQVPLLASHPLADVLWVGAIVAALVLWWRAVSSGPERGGRAAGEWALTAVVMLFVAPLSEDVHYVALIFPLAVLADGAARGTLSARSTALALGACLYFMLPWLDAAADRGDTALGRLLLSGVYLYGLALAGGALVVLLRERRAESLP